MKTIIPVLLLGVVAAGAPASLGRAAEKVAHSEKSAKPAKSEKSGKSGTAAESNSGPRKLSAAETAEFRKSHVRLGWFHTRFNRGQQKRTHNIRLAVKAIDGVLLPPGAVFSLNKTVGERTHARGYLTAPVFENKKLVPGIGGGVSQVTGTLFNAALLAGLPILQYRTHAKPVHYLPVGRDATIAWNQFDMRFKNNMPEPILISYKVTGSRLTATLYGMKPPKRKISLVVRSKKKSEHEINAELIRFIKRDGKVTREVIGKSHYDWKESNPD